MESDKIIEFLRANPSSNAKDIAKKLSLDKKIVNKHLYALKKEGKAVSVGETPPMWSLVGVEETVQKYSELRRITTKPSSPEKEKHTVFVGATKPAPAVPPKKIFLVGYVFDEGFDGPEKVYRASSRRQVASYLLLNFSKFQEDSVEAKFVKFVLGDDTSSFASGKYGITEAAFLEKVDATYVDGDSAPQCYIVELPEVQEI